MIFEQRRKNPKDVDLGPIEFKNMTVELANNSTNSTLPSPEGN
jgi:hypothetical protein